MTFLVSKILTLCMSLVMFFNTLGFAVPAELAKEIYGAELEYAFANSSPNCAAGTVELSANIDGEYKLYWGEDEDEKLEIEIDTSELCYSEFLTLEVENGYSSAEVQEFTAIPEDAEYILIYKGIFLIGSRELPQEKQANYGKALYNFGALSDIHFGRYFYSLGDDATMLLPNALNLLEKFDVELVAVSGDISNSGERESFEKFNQITSKYSFPVYTCTGNHDVNDEFVIDNWLELVNSGAYGEQKADGIKAVGPSGMDFVYSPEGICGDVFIFVNQYQWSYGNVETSRLVTDEQLDWLEEQLKLYKDTTVYLFFHTFFASPEGDGKITEGNLINPGGAYYDLVYTYGAADEVRFRKLLEENKNVVAFNGHSHWRYDMQKYNSLLNISDFDGTFATMVHISSVSSPRWVNDEDDDHHEGQLLDSQGYILNVYEDYIVLTGINFLRGEMLAYACYVIER